MSLDTDDLLASFDAEFGKKKKQAKKPAEDKPLKGENKYWDIQQRKAAGKPISMAEWRYLREKDAIKTVASSVYENAPVINDDFLTRYQPFAKEVLVMHQSCKCCSSTTEFIAGEYVKFRNMRSKFTDVVKQRADAWTGLWHLGKEVEGKLLELPREVEYQYQEVEQCGTCLRADSKCAELWDIALRVMKQEPDVQLSLELPNFESEGFQP